MGRFWNLAGLSIRDRIRRQLRFLGRFCAKGVSPLPSSRPAHRPPVLRLSAEAAGRGEVQEVKPMGRTFTTLLEIGLTRRVKTGVTPVLMLGA